MQRRLKVELFEQLRREYEFGVGTIAGVARQFGVHRRMVRQAVACAVPPERKRPVRPRPKWAQVHHFIDQILHDDLRAPRKQRHTARRIHARLCEELPGLSIAERTVRYYVHDRKCELGLAAGGEVIVPQQYAWGVEAQVDWYEAVVEIDGERRNVPVFSMRSMASGAAFHRAYPRATQQAFLEAHELAFHYFGGVFHRLRYDNLKTAVKKILRGHRREECERFVAFRSHWQFEASFCNPAKGNEKGGVEAEVGRFRRNHLVPVPRVRDLAELNEVLARACERDAPRFAGARPLSVGDGMSVEQGHLRPLRVEGFELAEESFALVDTQACVCVRTNHYSTPLRVGTRCRVRVLPSEVEIWHEARCVARHERCYGRRQQVLDLEHYLDVLLKKPGALAGSKPLAQWRAEGRWSGVYDQLWQRLQSRHGSQAGTRAMIEVLRLGRAGGYERLTAAITHALALGATDAAAVQYLLRAPALACEAPPLLSAEESGDHIYYTRPLPRLEAYDELLRRRTPPTTEVAA